MTTSMDAGQALVQVLAEGTAALAHLDAESLELLQKRALQVEGKMADRDQSRDGALQLELASRRRIFAEVLHSTSEQLALLNRLSGRGGKSPWDR